MFSRTSTQPVQHDRSNYVRVINGITFIDAIALEGSIDQSLPVKDHLRQKMINVGVEFWNQSRTIIKKPVVGISAIGGFSVSLEGDIPPGMIKLRMGTLFMGPMSPESLANGLRDTMGMQSSHTYMNPKSKTARELYDATIERGHFSIAHAATLSIIILGLSKKAELEFDVQRDVVHLARETSARTAAQDEPTLVAMTERGAKISEVVRESISSALEKFEKDSNSQDWREERNSLYSLSAAVSLGINGTVRNLQKMVANISDQGKELEFRNVLALINDSLHGFFPELFKATATYGHQYPSAWESAKPLVTPVPYRSENSFFSLRKQAGIHIKPVAPKDAILLLGAPGVGKSTQTEIIVKQLPHVMCISTGNLVRKLDKKRTEGTQQLTPVEQKAAESLDCMKRGELMDDKAVYALLMAYLSLGGEGYEEYRKARLIILDGVIKADRNIEPFEAALNEFNQAANATPMSLKHAINITATTDELIARHHMRVEKAIADGIPQRPDDGVEIYKARLEKYLAHTQTVVEYYQEHHHLINVDSSQGIEQTTSALIQAIKLSVPTLDIPTAASEITPRVA